jgi:hypothetical protein
VTYWHVELTRHEVLLAENLPVESYLDNGTRQNFIQGNGVVAAWPDFSTLIWEAHGCAPLQVGGPMVEAVRQRLQSRAAAGRRRRAAA